MQKIRINSSANLYFAEYDGIKRLIGLIVADDGHIIVDHVQDVEVYVDAGGDEPIFATFDPPGRTDFSALVKRCKSFGEAIEALQKKGFWFL